MAKVVRTIPATKNRFTQVPVTSVAKRRVAAYARVSTDHEEQESSYDAQVDYYTNYIKSRDDWEFAGIYADEGLSGCSTKYRQSFNTMVNDALAGKIDLIVTKSVSRFARNTVDSLTTIRKLKEHGTEVFFEKEGIFTFDGKGELLLTIMSSIAQEESRSISENVVWGHHKRFADGKAMVPFGRFLGYDRGEDGNLVINPDQAVTVRLIYKLFLEGHSAYTIAKMLTERGIPTPGGKIKWNGSCVRSILTNEKYKGDALLQKVFTTDYLTKKKKKNEGEVPQYYVEGNHEAIISPEVFAEVQAEMERRKNEKGRYSGVGIFASKIKCGECGNWYGSKVWHSNDEYRKTIYRCNNKYRDGKPCQTPHLTEDEIKDTFVKAVNVYLEEKDELLTNAQTILLLLSDTTELKLKQNRLSAEMSILMEQIQELVTENARVAVDQSAYAERYANLTKAYEDKETELKSVEAAITDKEVRRQQLQHFIATVKETGNFITRFDEELWSGLVDYITVYKNKSIKVTFKDGKVV